MSQSSLDEAAALINAACTVFVTSHRAPDGDAIGCVIGMKHIVEANCSCPVKILGMGDTPQSLRFICLDSDILGDADLAGAVESAEKPVVLVLMDASSLDRAPVMKNGPCGATMLNIDHHHTNTYFGAVNIVDEAASSASEMVLRLAVRAGWKIPEQAAIALYTGLLTDTMGFTLSNTNHHSFEAAAHLVQCGAKPGHIGKLVFNSKSPLEISTRTRVLQSLKYAHNGKTAYVSLTRDDCKDLDLIGPMSYEFGRFSWEVPASLADVAIAFSVTEHEHETGASFRSNVHDVSILASKFGGGGHMQASGCMINPPIPAHEFINRILDTINDLFL